EPGAERTLGIPHVRKTRRLHEQSVAASRRGTLVSVGHAENRLAAKPTDVAVAIQRIPGRNTRTRPVRERADREAPADPLPLAEEERTLHLTALILLALSFPIRLRPGWQIAGTRSDDPRECRIHRDLVHHHERLLVAEVGRVVAEPVEAERLEFRCARVQCDRETRFLHAVLRTQLCAPTARLRPVQHIEAQARAERRAPESEIGERRAAPHDQPGALAVLHGRGEETAIAPPVLRPVLPEAEPLGDVCPAPALCIHRPDTAGHVVTVIVVEADGPRLILHDIVTATADDAHRDRSAPRTPD